MFRVSRKRRQRTSGRRLNAWRCVAAITAELSRPDPRVAVAVVAPLIPGGKRNGEKKTKRVVVFA